MEMGNVSKRQKPDQRADNSLRSSLGFQCSEKFITPDKYNVELFQVIQAYFLNFFYYLHRSK